MSAPSGITARGRAELGSITARGRRLVTVADAAAGLDTDRTTAAKKLSQWTDQGWLRRVRRGLYIPVPVNAENPASWSEDPLVLADAVWDPCYFTGWTAANHWGLTEQIFRTTVVKTAGRVRRAREQLLEHDYLIGHIPNRHMEWGLKPVWRDERRVRLADPARVVIDVLDNPVLGGGIRHAAEILSAYLEESEWRALIDYGDRYGNRTVFKRLGYLVEALSPGQAALLEECRSRISTGISPLEPAGPEGGPQVGRWSLRANVRIEAPDAS